ncbi:uncharacterized protein [Miscanthus floridulus]|uniref:uncharacterized protein n=1 Tax=Miscanthus floridulus TaxID=154761 RepID=UPI003457B52B
MSSSALSDEEILCQVGETVEAKLRGNNLTPIVMRPLRGFLSLGMRDVRSSSPPVPEDMRGRAINRAHADVQKKRKDAKAAERMKQLLAREELDKHHRQQRKEVEVVSGALASSPALLGRGGEADPRSVIARFGAEADTPKARALGKRAISPMGSATVVERVVVETTPPPPERTEGAPGSIEDRPTPMDMEATPLPLRTRFAVAKRLPPRSSQKRPADELPLVPLKALKASLGSSAHWVAEAQAAIQRGVASARVDPKEPAAQGGAAEAAPAQTREGALPPDRGKAHELDGAGVPLVAEAPRVSEAEAMEDRASQTAETTVATVGVSASSEAMMAEARAPGGTDAALMAARASA